MKIERITLRQIRMPLVHFFETSFGAHLLARHHPGGSPGRRGVGLGRSDGRRESLLQRGVDRLRVADSARLRGAARARSRTRRRPRTCTR